MIKLKQMIKFFRKKSKEKSWQWDKFINDPRGAKGRRWSLKALLNGLFVGLLAGCTALRDAERLTVKLVGGWRWLLDIPRRISDTTMRDLLIRLNPKEFRPILHMQVKDELRSKRIKADALPIGVIAIDGKTIGTGEVGFHQQAQLSHKADGTAYGHLRVLRTVLISSSTQLCLDQEVIPKETNEMGFFASYFVDLLKVYGNTNLIEVVSLDAGMASRENANLIDQSNRAYVIALKENQPELWALAKQCFKGVYSETHHQFTSVPEAQTEWEVYEGKLIRRSLFRSREEGYLDWRHLRQIWLVVQETKDKEGTISVERRYFISSLLWNRLSAEKCLRLVRLHWGIENGCNWTLDTQWKEDQMAWCRNGRGVEVLSWLRLLAYNLSQMLRQSVLKEAQETLAWRELFDWVRWYLYKGRPDLARQEELVVVGI